jgi:hypothetical protein
MTDKLTKAARGQPCMLRLPGCDGGGETTVLCHVRYASIGGVGMKPPSICGIWGCHSCHSKLDSRDGSIERAPDSWESVALAGLLRTLNELTKLGAIRT